jgi:hypothetical protein
MGFFDNLMRGFDEVNRYHEIQKEVASYFRRGDSPYESARKCMCDLLMDESKAAMVTERYTLQVENSLLGLFEKSPVYTDLIFACRKRITGPHAVNFYRTGLAHIEFVDRDAKHDRPSRKLRFDLIACDSTWVWASLYDDGTRMTGDLRLERFADKSKWETIVKG